MTGSWLARLAATGVTSISLALGVGLHLAHPQVDEPRPPATVTIEAEPLWGQGPSGAWTPYRVTIVNGGPTDIEGEVVLSPAPRPPEGSPAGPFDAQDSQGNLDAPVALLGAAESFSSLGEQVPVYMAPGGGTGGPTPGPQVWPSYRTTVTLPAGGERSLEILVLEAPYGYRAELLDRSGAPVAEEPAPTGGSVGRAKFAVALLGRQPTGEVLRSVPDHPLLGEVGLTKIDSARDFPEDLLLLSGLQVVMINDFDTASLGAAHVTALRDFVAMGGSLVLGGGPTWARTLAGLPDELVPLRPSGTATVGLAPLSPEVAGSAAQATVAIGSVRGGRVTATSPDGAALVVEADYGLGLVVQLAYDPFAEPFVSDLALGAAAVGGGLDPALGRLRLKSGKAPEALWWPALDAPVRGPAPAWPRWGVGLLGAYALALAPITAVGLRRGRGRRDQAWMIVPGLGVLLAGAMVVADPGPGTRSGTQTNRVEVQVIGADGIALVHTFGGIVGLSGDDPGNGSGDEPSANPLRPVTGFPAGIGVSSVIGEPSNFGRASQASAATDSFGFAQPTATGGSGLVRRYAPEGSLAPGRREVAIDGDGAAEFRVGATARADAITFYTLARRAGVSGLEGSLRQVGGPGDPAARVVGNLTNNTGMRVTGLVASFPERGRALMATSIEPGATIAVDLPLVSDNPDGSGPVDGREMGMLASATRFISSPDKAVVAASVAPRPGPGDTPPGTSISILVQVLPPG